MSKNKEKSVNNFPEFLSKLLNDNSKAYFKLLYCQIVSLKK